MTDIEACFNYMAMVYFFLLILEALESFCAKALKMRSQIKRETYEPISLQT